MSLVISNHNINTKDKPRHHPQDTTYIYKITYTYKQRQIYTYTYISTYKQPYKQTNKQTNKQTQANKRTNPTYLPVAFEKKPAAQAAQLRP